MDVHAQVYIYWVYSISGIIHELSQSACPGHFLPGQVSDL